MNHHEHINRRYPAQIPRRINCAPYTVFKRGFFRKARFRRIQSEICTGIMGGIVVPFGRTFISSPEEHPSLTRYFPLILDLPAGIRASTTIRRYFH